ncbi:hypothetical protein Gotur_011814 [Gossypium turneri]
MMSLTALLLRIIDPATDQRVPKLQSTKVEAMAEIEVRRAKAEADDNATKFYDVWLLREVGHDRLDQPEIGSECMTDSTCFKSFSIYRVIWMMKFHAAHMIYHYLFDLLRGMAWLVNFYLFLLFILDALPNQMNRCLFSAFAIQFILSVTRIRGRFKDRNLLTPAKRWWKGVPVYL